MEAPAAWQELLVGRAIARPPTTTSDCDDYYFLLLLLLLRRVLPLLRLTTNYHLLAPPTLPSTTATTPAFDAMIYGEFLLLGLSAPLSSLSSLLLVEFLDTEMRFLAIVSFLCRRRCPHILQTEYQLIAFWRRFSKLEAIVQ